MAIASNLGSCIAIDKKSSIDLRACMHKTNAVCFHYPDAGAEDKIIH